MANSENYNVGIIGSGKMGTDIFYYLADFHFNLTLVCLDERERKIANDAYLKKLDRQLRNGIINDAFFSFRQHHTNITCQLKEVSGCDIIIEAVTEDVDVKSMLFGELDALVRDDAVVVSNSSSIKPSHLTGKVRRTGYHAGLHFFFPVKYKNIVEVITADHTSEGALDSIKTFLSAINKFYIVMHEDDGFILNKIFLDLQAQAYRFYSEGTMDLCDIDGLVKRDLFPGGVFEFFDNVGIDVIRQSVLNYTRDQEGGEFYFPMLAGLERMVRDNRLGKKSGAGFFNYTAADSGHNRTHFNNRAREVSLCLASLYINSAFKALEKKICSPEGLEYAVKEYTGASVGPFALADEIGINVVLDTLTRNYEKTGFRSFSPSHLIKQA